MIGLAMRYFKGRQPFYLSPACGFKGLPVSKAPLHSSGLPGTNRRARLIDREPQASRSWRRSWRYMHGATKKLPPHMGHV